MSGDERHRVDQAAWEAYRALPAGGQMELEARLFASARDDLRARMRLEAGCCRPTDANSPTLRLLVLREMMRRRLGAVNAAIADVARLTREAARRAKGM